MDEVKASFVKRRYETLERTQEEIVAKGRLNSSPRVWPRHQPQLVYFSR
jgi:hypothetical protein